VEDVAPKFINPSIYGLFGHDIRLGAVFASASTNQGPDFAQAKADSAPPPVGLARTARAAEDVRRSDLTALIRRAARQRRTAKRIQDLDLVALVRGKRQAQNDVTTFNGFKHGGRHKKVGRGGTDYMYAGKGNVTLDARAGTDTLRAGPGNDTLIGGDHPDKLFGGHGHDRVIGGRGNDLIVDAAGAATIDTGPGNNVVDVRGHPGRDTITCPGSGRNLILAMAGDTIAPTCKGDIRITRR
jgi:Ca2+-binding RTX toxin-like protein